MSCAVYWKLGRTAHGESNAPYVDEAPNAATAEDLSLLSGRYVEADLIGGKTDLYVQQSGHGRDVLLLHTAGADSRQFNHLMANPHPRRLPARAAQL